jgi:hypothetical protein
MQISIAQAVRYLPWVLLLSSFLPFLRPHPHSAPHHPHHRHESAANHISDLYTAAVDDPNIQQALDAVETKIDSLYQPPARVRERERERKKERERETERAHPPGLAASLSCPPGLLLERDASPSTAPSLKSAM